MSLPSVKRPGRLRRRAATLAVALLGTGAWGGLAAAPAEAAGLDWTAVNDVILSTPSGAVANVLLTEDVSGAGLVIPAGVTVNLDLNGHDLIVAGASGKPGIQTTDATLRIQDSVGGGSLTATGDFGAAGIGGAPESAGGTVVVESGTVTATGGALGAGIGGGAVGAAGSVSVTGGTVTATGGTGLGDAGGAGIGGGGGDEFLGAGAGGTITVSAGADVTTRGGDGAHSSIGSNRGQPYGTVENSGDLTLLGNTTIYSTMVNNPSGEITIDWRIGGPGVVVNRGTIVVLPLAQGIAIGETRVIYHHYRVSYDLAGAAGTTPPMQRVYARSFDAGQVTLPTPPDGTEWRTEDGTPVTGATDLELLLGQNADPSTEFGATAVTLFARAVANQYAVTFDSAGGSPVPAQQVPAGGTAVEPSPPPTRDGFTFDGWYRASMGHEGGTRYDFAAPVTGPVALTAHWTEVVPPAPSYRITGFGRPVDMSTGSTRVWNTIKGGRTVPLRFEVFDAVTGIEVTDIAVVAGFTTTKVACATGTAGEDAVELTTTGGTSLRYDAAAGEFVQSWRTPTSAGSCYQVTVRLTDGTVLDQAYFEIKR